MNAVFDNSTYVLVGLVFAFCGVPVHSFRWGFGSDVSQAAQLSEYLSQAAQQAPT